MFFVTLKWKHEIAAAIYSTVSTYDTKSFNDLSAYRNCTCRRQLLCNVYLDLLESDLEGTASIKGLEVEKFPFKNKTEDISF